VRLGAEQLSNALLPNHGVALRAKAGAHEDVLNVAQAAQLAVQQVLAFSGAEQAAGDNNFALLCGRALKLTAPNLEHYRLRALNACLLFVCFAFFKHLAGLFAGDNFFCFGGALVAQFILIPVGRTFMIDDDFRLDGHGALVGFRVNHGDGNFGHAERLAVARAGKDHVLHVGAAERFGALFAQHPSNPVQNVRLTAAIWPHHHSDSCSGHADFSAVAEALEAEDVDLL